MNHLVTGLGRYERRSVSTWALREAGSTPAVTAQP
jgi:hypothetical protein